MKQNCLYLVKLFCSTYQENDSGESLSNLTGMAFQIKYHTR